MLRRRAFARAVAGGFGALATVSGALPWARPERHKVERLRDVPYLDTGLPEHRLDIWRPSDEPGPRPIVFYVHGGGFAALSKDTHWLMGLLFARRGFLVFNTGYRLGPRARFPAAAEDVCASWSWVVDHAEEYGGDPSRIVLAGESAGANLVAMLALAACYPRHETWARTVFERGVVPRAVLPACGVFQVSDPGRHSRRDLDLPFFVQDVLDDVAGCYLPEGCDPGLHEMADPVCLLERGERPARPLPPFYLPVGTRDPLLDDTRRMEAALERLGVPCTARYYPGEIHAFHALLWRPAARACWREMIALARAATTGAERAAG